MKKEKSKNKKQKNTNKIDVILNEKNKNDEIFDLDNLRKNNEVTDFIHKSDLKQIFEELLKADEIKDIILKTELTSNDGNQFCKSLALAEKHKFNFLIKIIFNWLCSRVSKDRQGRKELVDISLNALIEKYIQANMQNKIGEVKNE